MIIRAYLDWSRTAGASERADAAAMLAQVYLNAELSRDDRRDAEAALVLAVDDVSPLVRRALAVELGGAERAPRAVIAALACDQPEIAALVVANSPLFSDAEVADLAVLASGPVLEAACARPHVSQDLAAALAIAADARSACILLANPGAEVPIDTLRSMADRFGEDATFREALLERDDLPTDLRFVLAEAAARQLTSHCIASGWLSDGRAERLRRDSVEAAVIMVAGNAGDGALAALAECLRRQGRLTPQVLLRAVLSGEVRFFVAALADLAEIDERRAMGFVQGRSTVGFAALCRKAGLPRSMDPAFAAAVAAVHVLGSQETMGEGRLSRFMIEIVLSAIALIDGPEMDRLRAVLLGYLAEAMRDEARQRIADILAQPAPVDDRASPSLPTPVNPDAAFDSLLVDAVAQEFVEFSRAA